MPPTKAGSVVRGVGFSEDRNNIKFGYDGFEICVEHLVGGWLASENMSLELRRDV